MLFAEKAFDGVPVLVTGGYGFIGSHFVRRLVKLGAQVTVVDALAYSVASAFTRRRISGATATVGMIVTGSADHAEHVLLLRTYGERERFDHRVRGFNSRLDELQAAILRVKLRHLDA